jgi:hypothetical protein
MRSLSSAASTCNSPQSPSSHQQAFNDCFMCDVSMVHGSPSSPLPMGGELLHPEEYPQEQQVGVHPGNLGSSHTCPIANALANLP